MLAVSAAEAEGAPLGLSTPVAVAMDGETESDEGGEFEGDEEAGAVAE